MISKRPYFIRALHDWIVDSGFTPYLLVDATVDQVMVPQEFVEEGKIVLNLNPKAIRHLMLGNNEITFRAMFSGRAHHIYLPMYAIMAVYAKENGEGMAFSADDGTEPPEINDEKVSSQKTITKAKPKLRRVKKPAGLTTIKESKKITKSDQKRPTLRIVK